MVEEPTEPSTSTPSTRFTEGNASASREMEQAEKQQTEVGAQAILINAETHGKALVLAETADVEPAPNPEEEPEEDEVEEVLGHP